MANKNNTISILGCGWLGLPLARHFAGEGFRVKGSTTSQEKFDEIRAAGAEPFRIILGEGIEGDAQAFLQSDILVVDVPPERREDIVEYHVAQFSALIDALVDSPVRHLLMVSSTSVYASLNGVVTEADALDPDAADSPAGRALLYVEEMLRSESSFSTSVVRFGGLIGANRSPANYLSRMAAIAEPDQPMNLIHRDDCIGIIDTIVRQGAWGEVFNGCAPVHPKRRDYYGAAAAVAGVALPPDGTSGSPYKVVSSEKVEQSLGYRFLHPDPVEYVRAKG